jgi:hypothetical protein
MTEPERTDLLPQETVKAIFVLKRSLGVDLEDFRRRLRPRDDTFANRARRYVRSFVLDSGYRKREPIYEAVVECWFDDEPRAREPATSDALAELVHAGGASGPESGCFFVRDHLAKPGPIPRDVVKTNSSPAGPI